MRLSELIEGAAAVPPLAVRDPDIAGIAADSREIRPGYLFAALPGRVGDGRRFIDDALRRGAVAVLAPPGLRIGDRPVSVLEDDNPRRRLALMAARFFIRQPRYIAAVTGTNGKTSVASFARQLWTLMGHKAASLGTLGLHGPGFDRAGSLTTPDPLALHRDLAALADAGIDRVAMEASSHGLDQYRLDGAVLAAAAFTNLTRDHLDYHPSMGDYLKAKLRLFKTVLPPGAVAILSADGPEFGELHEACAARGHRIITYGEHGHDIRLRAATPRPDGQNVEVEIMGRRCFVEFPLPASFQAMNALCALGLVLGVDGFTEAAVDAAIRALPLLEGVPGRLQHAATLARGGTVYVDYAHTPDALETVLTALRPHARGRLAVVFGCGGDRDAGKRPLMGAIACRLADSVFVTDDNPRSEDPAVIRRQILVSCPGAREIGARAAAIGTAIGDLGPGDILVVAGKGHELGQIVGAEILPFDDIEACRQAAATGGAA